MRVLVLDNYDSFTWNLVQYLGELGASSEVVKNDAIGIDEIASRSPDGILISPGPCTPNEAGISLQAITAFSGKIPILGVCLGHQAIGQAFGGRVVRAERLMHGKTSPIEHDGSGVFAGLPSPFDATRYHSLCIAHAPFPAELRAIAASDDGVIQGVRHRTLPIHGVQFHPESVLTLEGGRIFANFLELAGAR